MSFFKILLMILMVVLEKCRLIKRDVRPAPSKTVNPVEERREKGDFTGSWRLEETIAFGKDKKGKDSASVTSHKEKGVFILSFFADSTYTQIGVDNYVSGKFSSADSTVRLTNTSGSTVYRISFSTAGLSRTLSLMSLTDGQTKVLGEYAYPLTTPTEDPFHERYNLWRIKPKAAEQDAQIRKRLENYLLHCSKIMKSSLTRHQAVVSWEFSPGIVRILNGGIGVVQPQGMPDTWIDCFYSRKDAQKARDMFETALLAFKTDPSIKGNWVEVDLQILQKLIVLVESPSS